MRTDKEVGRSFNLNHRENPISRLTVSKVQNGKCDHFRDKISSGKPPNSEEVLVNETCLLKKILIKLKH